MNISEKAKQQAESCRFCWMCRHVCPIGNADGQERNNARARALMISLVCRGTEKLEDAASNIYECSLCGACTNNCKTGWDPKIFIQEVKTQIVLEGKVPEDVAKVIDRLGETDSPFEGDPSGLYAKHQEGKTLLLVGQAAAFKDPESVEKAIELLKKAGVDARLDKQADETGFVYYFLTGKTEETLKKAKESAAALKKYDNVIVYNPVELSFLLHQWREWGIELPIKPLAFHDALKDLIEKKKLVIKKSEHAYALQDCYAYARELDDEKTARSLIEACGEREEMLLIGKEANLAGHLIMAEYMPKTIALVAKNRWINALNMHCHTLVCENPDEHVFLNATAPEGCRAITLEEMVLENLA